MATHTPFETLARVIDRLEAGDRSVRRTEAADDGDGTLRATLDVSIPEPTESIEPDPVAASADDGLTVTFRAAPLPDPSASLPPACPPVSVTPTDARIDGDALVVTATVTVGGDADAASADATASFGATGADEGDDPDADPGLGTDRLDADSAGSDGVDDRSDASDADPSAARDESVPPYDDVPYLRRLYEDSETFAEMSDRIEMDVSGETVRRYMIEAGIHSPTSYETDGETTDGARSEGADATEDPGDSREAAGPDAATLPDERLVADGIGLPEALTLREVADAVVDARTVHEVHREIGLSHGRTRRLLTQLNLLDLVVGRVGAAPDRAVTVETVADRIRECTPDRV